MRKLLLLLIIAGISCSPYRPIYEATERMDPAFKDYLRTVGKVCMDSCIGVGIAQAQADSICITRIYDRLLSSKGCPEKVERMIRLYIVKEHYLNRNRMHYE